MACRTKRLEANSLIGLMPNPEPGRRSAPSSSRRKVSSRTASGEPFYYNPSYCCGAAGCIDAFCDLYRASGEKRWLEAAKTLADHVVLSLRDLEGRKGYATYDDEDRTEKKNPYVATGFMHGNAGIGHALLRLALLSAGEQDRLILLPDHPFAHPETK